MKQLMTAFAALLVIGAGATSAMAEDFYGALDVGQTKAKDACMGAPADCKDTATLYRIAGGYQFTPTFGAEISYADYGKANLGSFAVFGVPVTSDWKITGEQLSVIGAFPLGDVFSLTGKVGVAHSTIKLSANLPGNSVTLSSSSTNLAWGIGALFNINNSFAIRAQYEDLGNVGDAATTGTAKVSLMSVGAMLRF